MCSSLMMTEEEKIEYLKSFPPGWRFNPTEEELIVEYLKKKLVNSPLPVNRIKDVNLYNHNPWDLTENFTSYGENEYYFFTPRDRRYPKGDRPKRAAGIGYWKATGKDKPIYDSNGVDIGSKMVLGFYTGKAPKGDKSPWVMHEYRAKDLNAEGTTYGTTANVRAASTAATRSVNGGDMQLDEWVLCKIFKKRKEEPAATPETPAALETPAAPETPVAPVPATAAAAAAENHLNIIQVENTATREENTARNIYPGSDIYYDQGMFFFGQSNEVSFLKEGESRHQEDLSSIEYKEERNYDQDMFNVDHFLVIPPGIDSSELFDP